MTTTYPQRAIWILLPIMLILVGCSRFNAPKDILTTEEKQWLKKHPTIRIAISTNFPPMQFTDENDVNKGLSVDFMELVEKKTGITFQRIYYDNWQEILKAGKKQQVDVILEIQENQERRRFFDFTHPFIQIPHAIIMRKSYDKQIALHQMQGMTIAVVDDYAIHNYLSDNYPDLTILPMPDDIACLKAVSFQEADAMVSSQALAVYFIQKEAISNLHIVGSAEYNNILAFAVRKDWPILTRIIDKGLSRISHSERNDIISHWMQLSPISFWKQRHFWIVILLLGGVSILLISIIALWNQTLTRKVNLRTQQLQKAKERAEESNRLKSSFLANMSHEIRTPLNAIQGFAELLNQNELNSEKKDKYTNIIVTNCKSLIHLINEILDLSKIEAEQITIRKNDIDIHTMMNEIIQLHSGTLKQKPDVSLKLNIDLPPSINIINTDEQRLKQILNNLISNATKFTHSGEIVVEINQFNEKELLFFVKDTGIGIDSESQKIIFDRFTKIEKDTTKLYRGSGLGLHISKKLLELLGGKIWVESDPAKGSIFYFTLPIKKG